MGSFGITIPICLCNSDCSTPQNLVSYLSNICGINAKGKILLITGGAKALVDHNITVNGYGPGVVRTELWEQLDKDLVEIGKFEKEGQSMDSLAENMILMKRYSYPEDVVGTAGFLASSDSDYMTGQLIMIDGGMIMQ